MPRYSVSKSFNWQGTISNKVAAVCRMFGLTADRLTERHVTHNCQLEINDGDIRCGLVGSVVPCPTVQKWYIEHCEEVRRRKQGEY